MNERIVLQFVAFDEHRAARMLRMVRTIGDVNVRLVRAPRDADDDAAYHWSAHFTIPPQSVADVAFQFIPPLGCRRLFVPCRGGEEAPFQQLTRDGDWV